MKHSELAGPKHDAIDKQIQALKDQIKKATDDLKGKTGSQRQNMIRFKETRQGMLENLQKKKAGIPARASLSNVKESAKLRLEVATNARIMFEQDIAENLCSELDISNSDAQGIMETPDAQKIIEDMWKKDTSSYYAATQLIKKVLK